jgi:hypothetical protein
MVASDLLTILGVNRIEDFKSANPTVIRREHEAQSNSLMLRAKILNDLKEASRILSAIPNGKEAAAHIDAAIRLIED